MNESINILIVEDETIISMDIKTSLEELGYNNVDTADSGEEALLKIAKRKPDIVFMDIGLAGEMDGIETTIEINKNYGNIPVVYLTSYSNERTRQRAEKTEYFDYLLKPFQKEVLAGSIESLFH